jgi:hypothetical protein
MSEKRQMGLSSNYIRLRPVIFGQN